jgi:hypothetical protein
MLQQMTKKGATPGLARICARPPAQNTRKGQELSIHKKIPPPISGSPIIPGDQIWFQIDLGFNPGGYRRAQRIHQKRKAMPK